MKKISILLMSLLMLNFYGCFSTTNEGDEEIVNEATIPSVTTSSAISSTTTNAITNNTTTGNLTTSATSNTTTNAITTNTTTGDLTTNNTNTNTNITTGDLTTNNTNSSTIANTIKNENLINSANPIGSLHGVVVDSKNNPIEGALVTIGEKSTLTNVGGGFTISSLDIGGADSGSEVSYNLSISKAGYTSMIANAIFDADTLVNEDEAAQISFENLTDLEVTGNGVILGGTINVPLSNAVASVKVTMNKLVNITGKIELPEGVTYSAIKIDAKYQFGMYGSSRTVERSYDSVDISLGNTVVDANTTISDFNAKIYLDGKSYAEYYIENESIDISSFDKGGDKEISSEINIGKIAGVNPYYTLEGTIYENATSYNAKGATVIGAGARVVLNSDTYGVTDENGNYIINEIKAGGYDIVLKDYDSNNDTILDYINGKAYLNAIIGNGSTDDIFHEESGNTTISSIGIGSNGSIVLTRDLWFEGIYNYSISGTVEVGIKGETVEGIVVKAYNNSTNKIEAETTTDVSGNYILKNVTNKNITVIAEEIDTDGNAVANYNKKEKSIINTNDINITNIDLFMAANPAEPNYKLAVENTNFTIWKANELVKNPNNIEIDGNIEITFNQAVSNSSINEIEARDELEGNKVVKLKNGSDYLEINYSFDSTKKILTIDPVKPLTNDDYKIELNDDLSTEAGFKYTIGNTLNTDLFSVIAVDVNVEAAKLGIASTNFVEKDANGDWNSDNYKKYTKLAPDANVVITFDKEVSQEKVEKIEADGEKVITVSPAFDFEYTFDATNKELTITYSDDSMSALAGNDEYEIIFNTALESKNEFDLSKDAGVDFNLSNELPNLTVKIDLDPYTLKVENGNFINPLSSGFEIEKVDEGTDLTIEFNMPVSMDSITDIENGDGDSGNLEVVKIKEGANYIGKVGYEFDTTKTIMTLDPQIALESGKTYTIELNSDLMAEAGYRYEVKIDLSENIPTDKEIIKAKNLALNPIKPQLYIPTELREDYTSADFVMNDALSGKIYKTSDLDESVKTYDKNAFELEFSLSSVIAEINDIKEFKIFAKSSDDASYWQEVGNINIASLTTTDIKKEVYKTAIDLEDIDNGMSTTFANENLKWGTEIYLTVIPVDKKGKEAAINILESLTLADKFGVEVVASTIKFGTNSIRLNEDIDPAKTYNATISGVNTNIGFTKKNQRLAYGSLNELKFEIDIDSSIKFVTDNEYNRSDAGTQAQVTAGDKLYLENELKLVSTHGLYEGMYIVTDDGILIVTQVVDATTIKFAYDSTDFDIANATEFLIAKKDNSDVDVNTEIYNRAGNKTGVAINSSTEEEIAVVNLPLELVDAGTYNATSEEYEDIQVSSAGTTKPLIGQEVGDRVTFELNVPTFVEDDITTPLINESEGTGVKISSVNTGAKEITLNTTNINRPANGLTGTIEFKRNNVEIGATAEYNYGIKLENSVEVLGTIPAPTTLAITNGTDTANLTVDEISASKDEFYTKAADVYNKDVSDTWYYLDTTSVTSKTATANPGEFEIILSSDDVSRVNITGAAITFTNTTDAYEITVTGVEPGNDRFLTTDPDIINVQSGWVVKYDISTAGVTEEYLITLDNSDCTVPLSGKDSAGVSIEAGYNMDISVSTGENESVEIYGITSDNAKDKFTTRTAAVQAWVGSVNTYKWIEDKKVEVTVDALESDTSFTVDEAIDNINTKYYRLNNTPSEWYINGVVSQTIEAEITEIDLGVSYTTFTGKDIETNPVYTLDNKFGVASTTKPLLDISERAYKYIDEKISYIGGTGETVLDEDDTNYLLYIGDATGTADPTNFNGKNVDFGVAEDQLILKSNNVKFAVGDTVVGDKDTSSIPRSDANIELEITEVESVYYDGGYRYKYTFNSTDAKDIEEDYDNGMADIVEFKPTLEIEVVATDSSGNAIQYDDNTIFYDIYDTESWTTK